MKTQIRRTAAALMLVAGAGSAHAQTVITREPVETQTIVPAQPLELSPAQRTTIYRTIVPQGRGRQPIVRERIVTEPVAPVARERVVVQPTETEYVVGSRVPSTVELAPVPESLAVEVPPLRPYRYMVINNRLLLVDPATSTVVADITQ